jgi:hypothetical protein
LAAVELLVSRPATTQGNAANDARAPLTIDLAQVSVGGTARADARAGSTGLLTIRLTRKLRTARTARARFSRTATRTTRVRATSSPFAGAPSRAARATATLSRRRVTAAARHTGRTTRAAGTARRIGATRATGAARAARRTRAPRRTRGAPRPSATAGPPAPIRR